jgi:hypothetical protein
VTFIPHPRDLVPLTDKEHERLEAGETHKQIRDTRNRLNARKDRFDPRGGNPYERTGAKAVP